MQLVLNKFLLTGSMTYNLAFLVLGQICIYETVKLYPWKEHHCFHLEEEIQIHTSTTVV